ncbi:hypothetical protein [Streptomyces sp. CRN 30]|uniref:hypothetical protein n=1 Tax=Streptomyces sp. CRN 30 TaxID=3075613 RepID=UPI002A7FF227|nr:hypothetical protein [Streptomyces sp. CRN 30]
MTAARTNSAHQELELVTTALQGEPAAHLQPVVRHAQAPKPPRPRRSRVPSAAGRRPHLSAGQRALVSSAQFIAWLTAPLDFLGRLLLAPVKGLMWLCRGKEKRRRNKRFAGGWDSAAGGLGIAMYVHGDRVLAVGQRRICLLHVGAHAAEVAWSVSRDELTGVEFAAWDTHTEQRATLRWHFRDGSWYDVRTQGPGWRTLVDALPVC